MAAAPTTTAPAPAAPPASPAAPTNPESKTTINVVPQPVANVPPPKPGSVKEDMFKKLRERAKPATGQAATEEPEAPASAPETPTPEQKPATLPAKPEGEQPAGTKPAEAPAAEDKKANPWKVVDRYKARLAEAEKKLAERSSLPEQEKAEYVDRIKKVEDRNKELENEIRFVNFKKSTEFKTKYEEPYQRAWSAAMSELKELTVSDGNGGARPMQFNDILGLVNLPLPEARAAAQQMFGDFANDVMAHRKTIKQLWDIQAAALDEAYKNGEAREKTLTETQQREQQTVRKFVVDTWNQTNELAKKDEKYGKFFAPAEGDQDGNQRLAKGFELVDRAFSENPHAPGLTEEQRAAIVKRHSAVRNRAAAFGRLVSQIEQRESRIAELEKELAAIKSSAPTTGGDSPSSEGTQETSAKASVFGALRKLAKNV